MATLYWGGGTGTWDGFTVSNWYTDFARTTPSTRAPSAEDDVIFDAVSNATAYTVTIANNTTVCRSCTIAGPATGNLTLAGSGFWYIYGNLTLPATGLTRTFTGAIQFYGAGAQTITTNGVALTSNITFAGSGAYTLQDALNNGASSININAGTFDTNGKTVTFGGLNASATTTGTLVLGASTVSATTFLTLGSLSISAGTSNISLSNSVAGIGSPVGSTFYNVTFSSTAITTSSISGNNTFNNLTFATRGSATVSNIVLSGNQTINGTLTISGQSSVNRYFVQSNITGTTRTLTVATVAALTDVDFRDITVAGASAPWSGTQLGDCGGNTGITFPSPKTVYWNGTTGGAWTGNFWAASSGGAVSAANFPLAQDTAIIDDTGLNTGRSITGGVGYNLKTLTSTKTNAWTLSTRPIVYGDVTLTPSMTATAFGPTFAGRSTQNLTTAVNTIASSVSMTIAGYNASVKLMDRLFVGDISIVSGGFDTNNQTISSWASLTPATTNTGPFSLTLGSSAITFSGTSFGSLTAAPPMTVSAGTSTITLTNAAASFGFAGQTLTWYNVTKNIASTASNIYGVNTFNNLTLTAPTVSAVINLGLFGDQTVNGTFAIGGGTSATQRMGVVSGTIGTQRTITAASVTGLSDVDFRDIAGAGAATWTGGTRIGDCGGNSGIGFDAPKTVYWNLAGTQNWNATGWATTPTGTPAVNNFPLAQDTATFTDAGSAGTVTFSALSGVYNVGTIDASGRTSALTLAGSTNVSVYGNITYGSGVTSTVTGGYIFSGATTQTLISAGKTFSNSVQIVNPSCNFLHGDAFTTSGGITVTGGSYDTQNYSISCVSLVSNVAAGTPRSVALGTSVVTLTNGVNFTNSTGLTFNGASSTINLSSTAIKTFSGGGQTFGTVSSTGGTGSANPLTIGGSNTFGTLTNSAYTYLIFTSGTTQTVTNFTYTGASGSQVLWYTNTPGQRATIVRASSTVGANSVDGGNNSGLTFTGSSPNYFYVKDIAYSSSAVNVTVPVTGVVATGAVGTVVIPNVGVSVTGVSATGAVGSVTVSEGAGITVQPTGVSATGAVGTVTIVIAQSAVAAVTGVEAAGQIGTVVVTTTQGVSVAVTGVEAAGAVGTVVVVEGTGVTVVATGVGATGAVGTVTVIEGQGVTATFTGVSATGAVGTVTVVAGQGIAVPTTGVQATGFIGTVTVTGAANVFPVGVVGYGLIGTVNVWGLVDDIQTANWQNVGTAQTPAWVTINNTQSSGWNQIPT